MPDRPGAPAGRPGPGHSARSPGSRSVADVDWTAGALAADRPADPGETEASRPARCRARAPRWRGHDTVASPTWPSALANLRAHVRGEPLHGLQHLCWGRHGKIQDEVTDAG